MGEYWCSRHEKIQPYAYVLTTKNREIFERQGKSYSPARMLRKIPNFWLHPKWFGAADIIFPHGELDCSELALNDDTGEVTPAAANSWIADRTTPVIFAEDNWHPKNRYKARNSVYGSNLCQADPLAAGQDQDSVPVFSGRCASHFSKEVSPKFFQGCNLNANSPEFAAVDLGQFTEYKEYMIKKQNDRLDLCSARVKCKVPNSTKDVQEIQVFRREANVTQDKNITTTRVGYNDARTTSKVYQLRVGAKYHGILCSVIGFFLTPVYIFAARYYKETFLKIRRFSTPWWYWIHFMGSIVAATLFASGYGAMSWSIKVWGRSEDPHAVMHMYTGYSSLYIFAFLLLFGWCRCAVHYVRAGKCLRFFSLAWHSVLGYTHHILNIWTIMSSTRIPRSPSLSSCDPISGLPDPHSKGPIYIIVMAFITTEVLFHLLMSVYQYDVDRPQQVRRKCWLPLLPLLPISAITDYAGSTTRKVVLYIYLAVMLGYTVAAIYYIALADIPENCKSGPMSCKHAFGCTKLAIQYEKWYKNKGGLLPSIT